ncbi:chloride channel protein [Chloroflexales bacterium ZM16-3]|nr:chloride channel protein [Chloroflexales bacterium ZM16-3]
MVPKHARMAWRTRLLEASRLVLGAFQRIVPGDSSRMLILTLVAGALCGLAAVAFHFAIQISEGLFIRRALDAAAPYWIFWTLVTPTVGGLVSGALLAYVVPDARGSGIPQVKVAYVVKGGQVPFRTAVGKFLIGAIQIGTGSSLGREGPTVQVCAGVTSTLGRMMALSRQNQRRLLPVGAAAGIAAAFNAPIAAVTFVIEEILGDLDQSVLSGIIVAAAVAAVIERAALGADPEFVIPSGFSFNHIETVLFYGLLGVLAAGVSILFSDSLLSLRRFFQRLKAVPLWVRPAIGGFVTGALAIVAILIFGERGITGAGYDTLTKALNGNLTTQVLLAMCGLKLLATVFSYSSGGAGGIFAPALFIGGMLGGVVGQIDVAIFHHAPSEVGAFALVGMGAVFAGIIRAPITSVLIIFELTGGYSMILPLMIANMTAYALASRWRPVPVYEALLDQDGIHLPHRQGPVAHALESLHASDAMTGEPITLSANSTLRAAIKRAVQYGFTAYPVLEPDGSFLGVISIARLRRFEASAGGDSQVRSALNVRPALFPDTRLVTALVLMQQSDTRQLAVVNRETPSKLLGIVAMSDILRAQSRATLALTNSDAEATASLSEVREMLNQYTSNEAAAADMRRKPPAPTRPPEA